MKKLFFIAMTAICLASCGDEASVVGGGDDANITKETRATKLFVQGKELTTFTQSTEIRSAKAATTAVAAESQADAHFFIRIDGRIPELATDNFPGDEYLPQRRKGNADMTLISDKNYGIINLDYPYDSEGAVYPATRYIYDSKGIATAKVLDSVPNLKELLEANQNTDYTDLINKINLDNCKVIWYVIKNGNRNGWHVDGVLTMKSTNDVNEIPGMEITENKDLVNSADKDTLPSEVTPGNGNIEVDIHQQKHQDWDEIKTSIHVRDLVDKVRVEIPLEKVNVAEADDFAIRTYDYELESKVFLNGKEYVLNDNNPINIAIEHLADKVVITISAINHDYIKALREAYGDGVTVEVHTYPKNLTEGEIFSRVQQSVVSVLPTTYDESKIKVNRTKYAE